MYRDIGQRLVWAAVAMAIICQPAVGRAYSTGIASTVFGPSGCPACHTGGVTPTVILSGPTTVAPGNTADYTLTIFGTAAQPAGGLNVAADDGTLSTGGLFAGGTQTVSGLGGRQEITHSAPKAGDLLHIIEFSFRWTAPPTFVGTVHLRGWGNDVNLNGAPSGDAAALATLSIVSSAPSPTPTATPTPAPNLCLDVAPLDPALVADDGQSCQKAIAKAGALYAKQGLKAAQSCLKALQASGTPGDPIGLCAGSAAGAIAPADAKAAAALAKAESKLRALIGGKCGDPAVAALGLCASTAAGLADCLLAAHHQGIVDAIATQYGALQPTNDPNARRCQGAIGKNAAGFLDAYLKASQKCLNDRNRNATAGSGAERCIGSMSGGFVPPSDGDVAAALQKATGKLSSKISSLCSETDVGHLDACAGNKADLIECLVCGQRSIAFALLGAQYGGN
ncbi:hypothetical protein KF840_03575 [bacterium]|nr:hypothetical protein [bacterium]